MYGMKEYILTWAPDMAIIARVQARTARSAKRKAPYPYRRFLGEIIAEDVPTFEKRIESLKTR